MVAVGAHPDDIEIAAGGLLLSLAAASPGVRVHYVLCTGSPDRQAVDRDGPETLRALPVAQLCHR